MDGFRRSERILDAVLSWVTVSLLVLTVGLVVLAVVMRYAVGAPLTYSYDLATLLFAWIVFLGLAVAETDRAHLAVDLTGAVLSEANLRRLAVIRQVFKIFLTLYLAWIGWSLFRRAGMTLPSLLISVKWLYASLPVGLAFLCLAQILALPGLFRASAGKSG